MMINYFFSNLRNAFNNLDYFLPVEYKVVAEKIDVANAIPDLAAQFHLPKMATQILMNRCKTLKDVEQFQEQCSNNLANAIHDLTTHAIHDLATQFHLPETSAQILINRRNTLEEVEQLQEQCRLAYPRVKNALAPIKNYDLSKIVGYILEKQVIEKQQGFKISKKRKLYPYTLFCAENGTILSYAKDIYTRNKQRIGIGGFKEAFAAKQPNEQQNTPDNGFVILKIKRDDLEEYAHEEYVHELQVAQEVQNKPYLAHYIGGISSDSGTCYLLQERYETTLRKLVDEEIPPHKQNKLMLEILTGVEGLHESGYLHSDLKPENIYVHKDSPIIADYGLSRKFDDVQSSCGCTRDYAAPEFLIATAGQGYQSSPLSLEVINTLKPTLDVWSLGIIFHEIVLGFRPNKVYADHPLGRLKEDFLAENPNDDPDILTMIYNMLHTCPEKRLTIREAINILAPKVARNPLSLMRRAVGG